MEYLGKNTSLLYLFTPQVIVNGVVDGNGAGGKTEFMDLVSRARSMHKGVDWHIYLDANDTDIGIDSDCAEAESHDILLVIYRAGEEVVKAGKGPNKGKKLKHANIAKQVRKIGEWKGGDLTMALPAPKSSMPQGEEAAVLVQADAGGPIVAAAKI
ncbi:thioredoxin-like protein [Clohesyomyces aquaticus]|uniref:Thioredoxin-like protein n=1 Tax=Clohesyomyces aquaticus TaxID=1231657 RepID=A0A1Y1XSH4_9PLEO|nr:thioredoxin-like protein [Clohesyomyces aquaticus]